MKTIPMKVGESRLSYLRKAASFARRTFNAMRGDAAHRHCHESFALRDALLAAEARYCDCGTFGVEHIAAGSTRRSPAITYLNSGNTYDLTILVIRGRFSVGCWGDIVERGNYA